MFFQKILLGVTIALCVSGQCSGAAQAQLDVDTPQNDGACIGSVDNFVSYSALVTAAYSLKPTVVKAVIDAHFNALIEQRVVTLVRAVHLKEELISCIESAIRRLMDYWEESRQEAIRNEYQATLAVLKAELANAQGLDVDSLFRGTIICNGQPRLCMTRIQERSDYESQMSEVADAQQLDSWSWFWIERENRKRSPSDLEAGLAVVAMDDGGEFDVLARSGMRNTGRACAIS